LNLESSWKRTDLKELHDVGVSFIKGIFDCGDGKHFVLAELELDLISLQRLWQMTPQKEEFCARYERGPSERFYA
jgi:hypothetical protein